MEELSQHVQSASAFASQNLKFAGQMSDDQRLFAGLVSVPFHFHSHIFHFLVPSNPGWCIIM